MIWQQTYDPLRSSLLSTLAAVLPLALLLGCIGLLRVRVHLSALIGLAASLATAVVVFGMPARLAAASAVYGAAYGILPIGWIIINVIFLYQLCLRKGTLQVLQANLQVVTSDKRIQLLLVAFCFGAFFEGAAGFGTPVAITAAMLIALGFPPLTASGLSLIANTAPVPYAALGTPLIALQTVTGLDLRALSSMVANQLFLFDLIIPFWLIWAYTGWKRMLQIWPALLVAGGTFAVTQWLVATFNGPWLVNIASSLFSMGALVLFLRRWQPARDIKEDPSQPEHSPAIFSTRQKLDAWLPWVILSACIILWSLPNFKNWADQATTLRIAVPYLDLAVERVAPIVPALQVESAVFVFNWLTATGTAILAAALLSAFWLGYSLKETANAYLDTILQVRYSLLTIAAMLALGFVTRYAGLDATLGLAFARTGFLYPFFGTLLGWLGVALTGSDTSSNVLFGNLQTVTAGQIGVSPVLMASANSAGGVMGKMIDAQSIVVASTSTRWFGHESEILRYVFFHSLALALLVALLVLLQAYVYPFTLLVVK